MASGYGERDEEMKRLHKKFNKFKGLKLAAREKVGKRCFRRLKTSEFAIANGHSKSVELVELPAVELPAVERPAVKRPGELPERRKAKVFCL